MVVKHAEDDDRESLIVLIDFGDSSFLRLDDTPKRLMTTAAKVWASPEAFKGGGCQSTQDDLWRPVVSC